VLPIVFLLFADEIIFTTSSTLKSLDSVSVEIIKVTLLTVQNSVRIEWSTNGNCENLDGFMVITQPVSATSSDIITGQAPCSARFVNLLVKSKTESLRAIL